MALKARIPVRGHSHSQNNTQEHIPVRLAGQHKMTKEMYYAQMRELFTEHFGEDFRDRMLEIKKRLRKGEAPEINKLYQHVTYGLGLFGGTPVRMTPYPWRHCHMYNLWDYDRINKLWKHL